MITQFKGKYDFLDPRDYNYLCAEYDGAFETWQDAD